VRQRLVIARRGRARPRPCAPCRRRSGPSSPRSWRAPRVGTASGADHAVAHEEVRAPPTPDFSAPAIGCRLTRRHRAEGIARGHDHAALDARHVGDQHVRAAMRADRGESGPWSAGTPTDEPGPRWPPQAPAGTMSPAPSA
jgi:hypothetical protein